MQNFKQFDGRWGGLPYAAETISAAGCGPTSVADIIGVTPEKVADWMTKHKFAVPKKGTLWEGIPAALKAYGIGAAQMNYTSLYGVHSSAVFTAWRQKIKDGFCGVALVGGPSIWTSGGHYIAVVGYDNDRYLVYDPAGRQDGYHPWSDFAGCIKILYTTEKRWKSIPAYKFTVPGLKPGKNSRAVTLFERLLAPLNIYKGPSDTSYGDACVAACKKVQELHSRPVTGNCLLAEWKIITGLPNEGSTFSVEEVKGGSQGASVIFVQMLLKAFGIYGGAVDGYASENGLTVQAIKEFQRRFGLKVDGIAGVETLAKLVGF